MAHPTGTFCPFTLWSSPVWITTSGRLPYNPAVYCIVAAILAIAYWLVIELIFESYFAFKKHDGLYFWSICISILGVILRAIGWTIQNFVSGVNPYLWTTLMILGMGCMVTGFSFVLYSRLHLVIRDRRILKVVLAIISFDAVAFLVPIAVGFYGLDSTNPLGFVSLLLPADRLYVNGYFIQEALLGCLYIWKSRATVLHSYISHKRKAITILIGSQVIVILLDIPLLVLAWMDLSQHGATIVVLGVCHPTIYAVKLKLELAVLNQFVVIVRRGITVEDFQTGQAVSASLEVAEKSASRRKSWGPLLGKMVSGPGSTA